MVLEFTVMTECNVACFDTPASINSGKQWEKFNHFHILGCGVSPFNFCH